LNHQEHINKPHRLAVIIRGAVQGVGFRPFVYRLASEMRVTGWVSNAPMGVSIEAEGRKDILDRFLLRLQNEIPPRAFIQSLEFSFLDPIGFDRFEIRESNSTGTKTTLILPDIATCSHCLEDIFDPFNRRYLYPFTNCTNCGPRFSIIEALPYDRPNTSMKKFEMCPECRVEYENPLDRRFHAQPNACPRCGPQLQLWDDEGIKTAELHEALVLAVRAIQNGKIVALKGLGGFHLFANAQNDGAVRRLRERKHREEKPFALMFPSLEDLKKECEISEFEERLLLSPESPIVLLQRIKTLFPNQKTIVSNSIASGNPYIGAMLPYTPLHHIFMHELGIPVVATSGNLSDEPICIDEYEALERLRGIADVYLVHNRPIVRHVDDSIVRVMMGRELVLRRARGYAPLPITLKTQDTRSLLAVGGHLKNTIALTSGSNIFISQHIGDLETQQSLESFHRVIADFETMYDCIPSYTACDLHPDYLSSKFAHSLTIPTIEVQHHYAHIASCMIENQLEGEVLGVSWDGTGYGIDGTIWGGEFMLTTKESFTRVATIRSFRLPGGEKAVKEPRRTAVGILYELFGDAFFEQQYAPLDTFTSVELDLIKQMLRKKVNAPLTTSVGRVFDAVASLIGLQQLVKYEGQAAMELEFLTMDMENTGHYEFDIKKLQSMLCVDWQLMIKGILADRENRITLSMISAKFHNTLAEMIIGIAKKIGQNRVVLSGGCFQNRYLTELTVQRLQEEGFRPYWHQRVPPNDGGIALGQAYAVLRSLDINRA
jgi:hydrogenase maturation protein HypF